MNYLVAAVFYGSILFIGIMLGKLLGRFENKYVLKNDKKSIKFLKDYRNIMYYGWPEILGIMTALIIGFVLFLFKK